MDNLWTSGRNDGTTEGANVVVLFNNRQTKKIRQVPETTGISLEATSQLSSDCANRIAPRDKSQEEDIDSEKPLVQEKSSDNNESEDGALEHIQDGETDAECEWDPCESLRPIQPAQ